MRYEYIAIVHSGSSKETILEIINKCGQEHWRLAAIVDGPEGTKILYFEREDNPEGL